jgi:hypothetical protein
MAEENKFILDVDVKPLKAQLKESVKELQSARQKFGEFSDEAINAANKVAAIRDEIEAANEQAQLFDPGKRFQALTTAATTAAAGVTAVQGAMAVFGNESEDVAKTLQKVQGALALSQGLSQLKDLGKVTEQVKSSFAGLTTGMSTFKKALISTGIGALIAGLGLLIANFDDVKKYLFNLFPALGKFTDFIGKMVNAVTDFIGVTSEAERQLDKLGKANKRLSEDIDNQIKLLTAQGGKEKEIYKLKEEQVNNELGLLRQSIKVKGELTEEESKRFRELKTEQKTLTLEYNKFVADKEKEAAEKRKAESDKRAEKEKQDTEKRKQEKEKADAKIEEADKILAEAQVGLQDKLAQDKYKVEESYREKVKKLREAGITDEGAYYVLELAKQKEINALDEENKKEQIANEEEYQRTLNDVRTNIRLQGLKDENEKTKIQTQANYQNQYADIEANEKLTSAQKIELKKALAEQEALELKAIDEKAKQQLIENQITDIDNQIKNAEFDFQLQKDLVERKKALYLEQYEAGVISQTQYTNFLRDNAKQQEAIDAASLQAKMAVADQVAGILSGMSELAGKDTAAGKALGIASATINTYTGATKALNSFVPAPEPFATAIKIAQAGIIVATGIKSIREISKTKVPSGGGNASVSTPNISAPNVAPQLPTIGQSPITSIERLFTNQKPLKAYVVESEVTGTQKRVSDIERRAGF